MSINNDDQDDSRAKDSLNQEDQTIIRQVVEMNEKRNMIKRVFPLGFIDEAKILLKITIPFAIGNILSSWLIGFVALSMIGHARGELELNASALAFSTYILIGNALMLGLNFGCDTLLPQCYGGNKRKMGLIIQRAFIITSFSCFISWTLMLNAKFVLKQIEPDKNVVELADRFLRSFVLIVPLDGFSMLLQKYIASNEKTVPLLIINLIGNCVNASFNYIFLYHLDFGIRSIPIAMTISYATNCICAFVYIRSSSIYTETWHPINRACLQEWNVYLKLSIPGVLMVMTEFWSIEQSIFFAARLGSRSLSAQVCAHQTVWLFYLVTSSFATAANIRIGQYLGSGKPEYGKNTKNVTYALAAVIILFNICFIVICHHWLPLAYNINEDALPLARRVLLLAALLQIWDGYNIINTGIVKACGQQTKSATVAFVGFYAFGIPFAIILMFYVRIDIYGFWLGVMLAETVTNILLFVIIERFDWQRHSEKALKRISFHANTQTKDINHEINNSDNEYSVEVQIKDSELDSTWFSLIVRKLVFFVVLLCIFIVGLLTSSVVVLFP